MKPNRSQRQALQALLNGRDVIFQGVPGSGKTTLGLLATKVFADQQVLFLTFNEEQRRRVRAKATKMGIPNLRVQTYPHFFRQMWPKDTPFPPNPPVANNEGNYLTIRWGFNPQPVALLVLDCCQSINLTTLLSLKALLNPHSIATRILVLGDPLTAIGSRSAEADSRYFEHFAHWFPERSFERICDQAPMRLPSVHTQFLNFWQSGTTAPFIDHQRGRGTLDYFAHMVVEGMDNPAERFYVNPQSYAKDQQQYHQFWSGVQAIQTWILHRLHYNANHQPTNLGDFVLIVPNRHSAPLLQVLQRWFRQNNWPFLDVNQRDDGNNQCHFRIRTATAFQGQEAQYVIVYDFSNRWFGGNHQPQITPELWIALSRSCRDLLLLETEFATTEHSQGIATDSARFHWLPPDGQLAVQIAKMGGTYQSFGHEFSTVATVVRKEEQPSNRFNVGDFTFTKLSLPPTVVTKIEQILKAYGLIQVLQGPNYDLKTRMPSQITTTMLFKTRGPHSTNDASVLPVFQDEASPSQEGKIRTNVEPLNQAFLLNEFFDFLFQNWYDQLVADFAPFINTLIETRSAPLNNDFVPKAMLFLQRLQGEIDQQAKTPRDGGRHQWDRATKLQILSLSYWLRTMGGFHLFGEIAWSDYHWLDHQQGLEPLLLRAQMRLTLDEEGSFFLFPRFQMKVNDTVLKRFSQIFNLPPLTELTVVLNGDLVKQNRPYDLVVTGTEIGLAAKLKMLFNLLVLNEFQYKDWYDDELLTERPKEGRLYHVLTGELLGVRYHRRAVRAIFQLFFQHYFLDVNHADTLEKLPDDQFVAWVDKLLAGGPSLWLQVLGQKYFS